jgi:hypothetical protein
MWQPAVLSRPEVAQKARSPNKKDGAHTMAKWCDL